MLYWHYLILLDSCGKLISWTKCHSHWNQLLIVRFKKYFKSTSIANYQTERRKSIVKSYLVVFLETFVQSSLVGGSKRNFFLYSRVFFISVRPPSNFWGSITPLRKTKEPLVIGWSLSWTLDFGQLSKVSSCLVFSSILEGWMSFGAFSVGSADYNVTLWFINSLTRKTLKTTYLCQTCY